MKLHSELKWEPPTDIVETEEEIVVIVEIAGMAGDDFEVVTDGKVLSVGGFRKSAYPDGKKHFHTLEIQAGPFGKKIALPVPIDQSKVSARYSNGMLEIRIPKLRPDRRTRRVPIR